MSADVTPNVPAVSVLMPVFNAAGVGTGQRTRQRRRLRPRFIPGRIWRRLARRIPAMEAAPRPCAQRGEILRRALDSILEQSFTDFELVLVDDASTDETPRILGEYASQDPRIRIFRNPENLGVARSLNRGLAECRAPLIARHDADDMSTPTRLDVQVRFMREHPDVDLCGTGMYVIDEVGKLVTHIERVSSHEEIVRFLRTQGCPFVHGSVMFRAAAMREIGGYSEDAAFRSVEDYEAWTRFAVRHRMMNIPATTLYFHRNHAGKISTHRAVEQERQTSAVRHLAAERLGGGAD